ncbi:MAG: helix-turn-helix domain-containing protein [Halobacteriales archaeon]
MEASDDRLLSRKRLQAIGEQLANDRKLDILWFAAEHEQFTVAQAKQALDLPHTTAHEYCRDLQRAGLLRRVQEKPAAYAPVDFDIHLSLAEIASAVKTEDATLDHAIAEYGEGIIDEVLDVWERVETGEYTYREASGHVGMAHADFLRVASELELFER